MRKGDRVEFEVEGETVYGVVSKGGKRDVTVILDGGKDAYGGPPSAFRKSDEPLPTDEPSVMDKYSIKNWKSAGGEETERFEANLYRDGKCIGTISNGGTGGGDFFQLKNDDYDQLQEDVKEWAEQMGANGEKIFELDSFWAQWWKYQRPYGVTAKQAISDYLEKVAEWRD